jgi:hypothetical protein
VRHLVAGGGKRSVWRGLAFVGARDAIGRLAKDCFKLVRRLEPAYAPKAENLIIEAELPSVEALLRAERAAVVIAAGKAKIALTFVTFQFHGEPPSSGTVRS